MSCLCSCTSTQATLLTLRATVCLGKEERATNHWRSSRHYCMRKSGQATRAPPAGSQCVAPAVDTSQALLLNEVCCCDPDCPNVTLQ